jgi:hypothetical protein
MRMHQLAIGLSVGAVCGSVAGATAEEYRGTYAQQMACTPDVFRLCGSEIPDVGRIVACLRQNEQQLGAPCKAVFESNAEAAPGDVAQRPAPGQGDVATPRQRGQVRVPVR